MIGEAKDLDVTDLMRSAIRGAEPSVLLMSYVHLTGDYAFIDRFRGLIGKVRDSAHSIPEPLLADLRRRVEEALRAGVEPRLPRPDLPTLQKMMSICAGEDIPAQYLPMLLSEFGHGDVDPVPETKALVERSSGPRVAIVGGGLSGVCLAILLKQAGIAFELYERNASVGGTWYENQYPGCGVDTANHWYSYSFALNPDWSRYFVKQPELRAYIEQCVKRYGIDEHIRLNTAVVSAAYDEASNLWELTIEIADGQRLTATADIFVSAVGMLSTPSIPDIPGLDSFEGSAFHTARWETDVEWRGKRVALIGSGASGIQVAPAVADEVSHLAIFQRSPQWIFTRPNYGREVPEGIKWALRNIPFYAQWYRFQLLWAYSDALFPALVREEGWNKMDSVNPFNEQIRKQWTEYIHQRLADRPDLLAHAIPDFPPFSKRPLFDTGWYDVIKRDNVALIRDEIARIVPEGIETAGATLHPVDIIVLATGFQASFLLQSLDVRGKAGHSIRDEWGEENPKAYLGMTVPGFPNFFVLNGPNTAYAHGGSIAFNAECQSRYVLHCIRTMMKTGISRLEVKADAYERYNQKIDKLHESLIWNRADIKAWYKNSQGRVTAVMPMKLGEYWDATKGVNLDDYVTS